MSTTKSCPLYCQPPTLLTLKMYCFLWEGPTSKAWTKLGCPHLRFVETSMSAETGCFPLMSLHPERGNTEFKIRRDAKFFSKERKMLSISFESYPPVRVSASPLRLLVMLSSADVRPFLSNLISMVSGSTSPSLSR